MILFITLREASVLTLISLLKIKKERTGALIINCLNFLKAYRYSFLHMKGTFFLKKRLKGSVTSLL